MQIFFFFEKKYYLGFIFYLKFLWYMLLMFEIFKFNNFINILQEYIELFLIVKICLMQVYF